MLYPVNTPYLNDITYELIEKLFIEHKWKIFIELAQIIYRNPHNQSIVLLNKRTDSVYALMTFKNVDGSKWTKMKLYDISHIIYSTLYDHVVKLIDGMIKKHYLEKTPYTFMNNDNSLIYSGIQSNYHDETCAKEYIQDLSATLKPIIMNNERTPELENTIVEDVAEKARILAEKKKIREEKKKLKVLL